MNHSLPYIPLSVVRYYALRSRTRVPGLPPRDFFLILGQTPYSQLILIHASENPEGRTISLKDWVQWQEIVPLAGFNLSHESISNYTENAQSEIFVLTAEHPDALNEIDFSEALSDVFEIVTLFLIGALQPAIQLLDHIMETDLPTVIPLREILQRLLPEDLKTNILGEYQLFSDLFYPDDFIPLSLIWLLGKTNMAGIEHFLRMQSEDHQSGEDDEPIEYWKNGKDSEYPKNLSGGALPQNENSAPSLSEAEKNLKLRFEDELKHFYTHAAFFYSRLTSPHISLKNLETLSPGTKLKLHTGTNNLKTDCELSVQTQDQRVLGCLRKELADLLLENMQRGYHYSVEIAAVLPEDLGYEDRIHLLIRRHDFQLN